MTWSVYQHWDPLRVCVVGRSYPPEFYSWIKIPHVRKLFERIAIETEEDYQGIIKLLERFGVEVLRPEIPEQPLIKDVFLPPPMTPRDYTAMIGEKFYYTTYKDVNTPFKKFYKNIKDPSWPDCNSIEEFKLLPEWIRQECVNVHQLIDYPSSAYRPAITYPALGCYNKILEQIATQGNTIKKDFHEKVNGAMVARIGKDLYFGTGAYDDSDDFKKIDQEFTNTRNHMVDTKGHSDSTYCPVCPGLIISLTDAPTYKDTFPGWEVVHLPGQSWSKVKPFLDLKEKNRGRWWIPGFEYDNDVVDVVETWLGHWTGYVEETVFDVNMLIIDPKNVAVIGYNKKVFDALERYGITPHIVPFRHRYFWDGGIHCVTSDLHREGTMQDFFPGRSRV